MSDDFVSVGTVAEALFTFKLYRGEGMVLMAMNWKGGPPPDNFAGFALDYHRPGVAEFFPIHNLLRFDFQNDLNAASISIWQAPFQRFRWIHFPSDVTIPGPYTYRATPMFMDDQDALTPGVAQSASIELGAETHPGKVDITFTRGFVSSQAFVRKYQSAGPISTLLPGPGDDALGFAPTHPQAEEALAWMGFEARRAILGVLDAALADPAARVSVVAYDLDEPAIVERLFALGKRLSILIDNSESHGNGSDEARAASRLRQTARLVKRQHLGGLQHNKTIIVDAPTIQRVVCGSTNFTWRGMFVQCNNAMVLHGADAVRVFQAAFDAYATKDATFPKTPAAQWQNPRAGDVDIKVAFSPHNAQNAVLHGVAHDIRTATSNVLYSLAFLYQTPGEIRDALTEVSNDDGVFVYGISDRPTQIVLQRPDGTYAPVYAAALSEDVPEPFKSEPIGGGGVRMHHKFVVIDFDRPSARVYLGSYNFSVAADRKNGENLLIVRDRKIATSYMIEAIRIFDAYSFRVAMAAAKKSKTPIQLRKPPRAPGDVTWFAHDYGDPRRIRDRELFG